MRKLLSVTATAIATIATLAMSTSALTYSDTNKDIEIVFGEYAGYRFYGPDAPVGMVDTSQIATVKFYIKVPEPIEDIEGAVVELAYNSGTTGWVDDEYDLNEDGLIIEMEVLGGVVEGDFFDVGLTTWSESLTGTYSVELLDSSGKVISEPVYPLNENENENTNQETTPETSAETSAETSTTTATQTTSVANTQTSPAAPVSTGYGGIITATVMAAISVLGIISLRKNSGK